MHASMADRILNYRSSPFVQDYISCQAGSCSNDFGIQSPSGSDEAGPTLVCFGLAENKKYDITVEVEYNGGVVQWSQSVEISEYN